MFRVDRLIVDEKATVNATTFEDRNQLPDIAVPPLTDVIGE